MLDLHEQKSTFLEHSAEIEVDGIFGIFAFQFDAPSNRILLSSVRVVMEMTSDKLKLNQ